MPITVSAYRFFFGPFACAGCAAWAAGAPTAPATATPAPVTADFIRNFRRSNGMSASPEGKGPTTRVDSDLDTAAGNSPRRFRIDDPPGP
ncbi:hypothetical protein GCM10010378_20180 [Streptomyces viridochromogenes]